MHLRVLLALALLAASTSVHAQRFNRKVDSEGLRNKNWEVSLAVSSQSGLDLANDGGSSIDVDSAIGWGFTLGYNLTNKWNFQYRFTLVKPDYLAVIVPGEMPDAPQVVDYTLSRYSNQLNATYHFFEGSFTPFLQLGAGWSKVDSNVPSSPPTTGCWWDPWWGYICDTTWNTYDTSEFTWNAGLGVRWDINGALFLRGSWNREFMKVDAGSLDFDLLSVDIGLMW
jgi:hypothetical protein